MPILDLNKYSNHLYLFEISSKEIESQIKKFKLIFFSNRNHEVEWGLRFPIFLHSFYKFIYNKKRIPSQLEFYQYYFINIGNWFEENSFTEKIMEGLKAWIYRTYP